MADKQIINLTEHPYANMTSTDVTAIESAAGTTFKAELADLKQYFLENRYIGGAGVSDITTNAGTQQLDNKTLHSSTLSGTVTLGTTAITATGTEINQLAGIVVGGPDADDIATIGGTETLSGKTLASPTITGNITVGAVTVSATELGYVDGATSNLQAQITAVAANNVNYYANKSWHFSQGWTEDTTTQSWVAAQILAGVAVNSALYVIDPTSLVVQTSILAGGTYTQQLDAVISWTTATTFGQTYLDTLTIANLTATTHAMSCTFKTVLKATA